MVLSLPSLGTILRSAGHRETRKLKAKSPFSRIRAFVYLSLKNLFPAELHLSRIFPIVSSFRGSMSRAEECRRDRRTFFSNEGRNSTRNGFMRLRVSSLSLSLSGVLTSRSLFAREFYMAVVEWCARYSNDISTSKMAHNGDNWLPLDVTRM